MGASSGQIPRARIKELVVGNLLTDAKEFDQVSKEPDFLSSEGNWPVKWDASP